MASRKRRLALTVCIVLALLGAACTEVLALPPGSQSFDPPPEYRLWWSMTEACSELRGSLSDIDWYVVPNTAQLPGDSRDIEGEWYEQGNRIALASAVQLDGALVRHEMLHALTRAGHTRLEFLERCAGTVVCADACIHDSGPPPTPPAGTPLVSASALEVSVEIQPAPTSGANFGGYFTLVVTAHNPANHAVIVQLPPYGYDNLGVTFEYLIGTDTTNEVGTFDVAYDPEATFFRPGESKREPFDLIIGDASDGHLPPGNYFALGDFAGHRSRPIAFTLSP